MPTEQDIDFNRSFLSLFMCTTIFEENYQYQNRQSYPDGPPRRAKKMEGDPSYRAHVHACPTSRAPNSQPRYRAYILRGKSLVPIVIIAKRDQTFEDYATPWEAKYSALLHAGLFAPVLDADFMVVGHYGSMQGEAFTNLIVPKGLEDTHTPLSGYLKSGVPVFVHSRREQPPPGWVFINVLTTEHRLIVVTTVDGQVVEFESENTGYLEPVDITPLDLLDIAKGLLAIGKLITTLGRGIGRRFARVIKPRPNPGGLIRAELDGATHALAKETEAKVANQLEAGRRYINRNPKATTVEQQVGRNLNRDAQNGLLPGFKRVEGGELPRVRVKGRKGDYDFITTDGRTIKGDLYEPESGNIESVISSVYDKSGQAEIVVVQFGMKGSARFGIQEARRITTDVMRTQGLGIQRVIVRQQQRILADATRGGAN